jgi:hypothetical protein
MSPLKDQHSIDQDYLNCRRHTIEASVRRQTCPNSRLKIDVDLIAVNVCSGSWLCENTGETGWRGKFVQFPEGMIF